MNARPVWSAPNTRAPRPAPAGAYRNRERRGRSNNYLAQLNSLANALQNSEELAQDPESFDTWCSRYLSHDRSPKPTLPLKSTPGDAPLYAQGYMDERQSLQPQRPPLPGDDDLFQ